MLSSSHESSGKNYQNIWKKHTINEKATMKSKSHTD